MKVVSRSKDDAGAGGSRASSLLDKLKNPRLIAELMDSDDDETPGRSRPSLLKKRAGAQMEEPSVPVDEEGLFDDIEEALTAAASASQRMSSAKKMVLLESDEEEEYRAPRKSALNHDDDEEAEMARLMRQEKERQHEAPVDTTPETEQERKRRKKQKRELARTNQQLLIQTALLGGDSEVPKKVPVKMSEFSFAQKIKERLQSVVGRFAPTAQASEDSGALCLTADMEVNARAPRELLEDEDGELVVVAEEPEMKLEPPRAKPMFRNDLDSIFGGNAEEMVGKMAYDSSRVWVSQLPTFQGVDLWDPEVTLSFVGEGMLPASEESSDGEYKDDHEIDDEDLVDDAEDEDSAVANSNRSGGEDDDDEEVLRFSDLDDDNVDGKRSPLLASNSSEPELLRRSSMLSMSASVQDSLDAGNSVMGSVVEEQGIGFMLNKAILSQQTQRSQKSQMEQPKKSVLDILTPKKVSVPFVAGKSSVSGGSSSGSDKAADELDDLFDAEEEQQDRDDEPNVHSVSPPVKRSLSLDWGMEDEDANDGLAFSDSQEKNGAAPELSQELVDGMDSQPIPMPPVQSQETQLQSLPSGTPPTQPMAIPQESDTAAVAAELSVSPSVPSANAFVIDPVERARRKATAGGGLDRFLVRGDAAKKLLLEKEKKQQQQQQQQQRQQQHSQDVNEGDEPELSDSAEGGKSSSSELAAQKRHASDIEDDEENEDDDLFDDEDDGEGHTRDRKKKKSARMVSFFDEEAVPSEEGVASKDEEEDSDEEKDGNQDEEEEEEDPEVAAAKAQEAEDMAALNKLRMEKDLHELNRIKDLYVLGQWKTEKQMQNRQQMGMEDYVDDEFAPSWNSIYNRDAIRSRLNKKKEGADGEDGQVHDGQEDQDGVPKDDQELDSSDDEDEYERKREKLKQSLQIAKINAMFHAEGSLMGASNQGSLMASSSLGGAESVGGMGVEQSLEGVLGGGENSRMSVVIENRRDTSNSNQAGPTPAMFGALVRDKTADIDPLQRFAMRRSNSKLLQTAQDNNLKRTRSATNLGASAGSSVNPGGRTFFAAGDENNSNSAMGPRTLSVGATGSSRRKPTTPKRLKVPSKAKTPSSSLLLKKKGAKKFQ